MSTELVPVTRGRPSTLRVRGGVIYVSIHDAYVVATYRALKRLIRDCHPDHRHWTKIGRRRYAPVQRLVRRASTGAYHGAVRRLEVFLAVETAWYAAVGLPLPPPLVTPAVVLPEPPPSEKGRPLLPRGPSSIGHAVHAQRRRAANDAFRAAGFPRKALPERTDP